ncbi:MAG: hypothetical protein HY080_08125 [Gammaproteobacteria bacterium]|nr:hypothetical protein [Gammaproteobacteria bacterium]
MWIDEGGLYLAVVLDLYSRLVIGYALSAQIDRAWVITVLRRALFRHKFPRGVILHNVKRRYSTFGLRSPQDCELANAA